LFIRPFAHLLTFSIAEQHARTFFSLAAEIGKCKLAKQAKEPAESQMAKQWQTFQSVLGKWAIF